VEVLLYSREVRGLDIQPGPHGLPCKYPITLREYTYQFLLNLLQFHCHKAPDIRRYTRLVLGDDISRYISCETNSSVTFLRLVLRGPQANPNSKLQCISSLGVKDEYWEHISRCERTNIWRREILDKRVWNNEVDVGIRRSNKEQ
jgi:hypothetical protein